MHERRRGSRPEGGWRRGAALLLAAVALGSCSDAADPSPAPEEDPRFSAPPPPLRAEPRDPLRHAFFGDLHIHTAYSYDAYTLGVRALPDDAYVYAKGGTIRHAFGYPIRLSRPLDFAAVTDHAEYLGVARAQGSETREESLGGASDPDTPAETWREIVAAAERHDVPGRFTTFIGYEWTAMPGERNLHRNVIYRSSRVPRRPVSALYSDNPEDLWRVLEAQRAHGMEAIAIPHNANASDGWMYARTTFDGGPLTAEYAATRMANEPVSEILQVKGQSEVHPVLATEDEFADFEIFDQLLSPAGGRSEPKGSYARDALKTGLELSARHGFNPYRFGFIGSSDGHNASSPVEESHYHGMLSLLDGSPAIRLGQKQLVPQRVNRGARWSAMGLAAVWAEENTREAIFDALRRKETYATSGPRITVRFFGGADLEPGLVDDPDGVARAYARGVPMGGELVAEPGKDLRFWVSAWKDPEGAHLDRIQVVKGWVDAEGASHERIFDVAASDGRTPDPETHRVGPVGSTVDVARASYENTIGAARLEALWSDPELDASQEAFYYARVLEIPTPRWSTFDARDLGVPAPRPATLQERAITSAIWVRPATVR